MGKNPGLPFDRKHFEGVKLSESDIEKSASEIIDAVNSSSFFDQSEGSGNGSKRDWLICAVELIDLTTLSGIDSSTNVKKLSKIAIKPLPDDLADKLELKRSVMCPAICVYPACIKWVKEAIQNIDEEKRPNIASVAAGFPSGLFGLESRLAEIRYATCEGANEIDIVIQRHLVLDGEWEQLYNEIKCCKEVCEETGACMKTILSTGELGSMENVYKASMVAMLAGSDFIKTSTGKEDVNATIPVGVIMCKAIQDYYRLTNETIKVGLKPAGGLKTSVHAFHWIHLVYTYLGSDWMNSKLFRLGASSLLNDVISELVKLA